MVRIIPSICSTAMSDFVFFATGEKDYSNIRPMTSLREIELRHDEEAAEGAGSGRRLKGELKEIADCGMRNVELGEREETERQIDPLQARSGGGKFPADERRIHPAIYGLSRAHPDGKSS